MISFQPQQSHHGGRPKPRDYFSRREQYRLLMLTFALLLVFSMMFKAAQPATWHWMFAGERDDGQSNSGDKGEPELDSRLERELPAPLPAGVFVSPLNLQAGLAENDAPHERLWGGLTTADYAVVRDDTPFRASESEVWFRLLATLHDSDHTLLDSDQVEAVGFTQLFKQPRQFRGRLVGLEGIVRRAHRLMAPPNEHGITAYWRCWLFIDGTKNPIVVYALRMPDGFPQGMSIHETIELAGVFFKRWAYNLRGGIRTAPVVVAQRPVWRRSTAMGRGPPTVTRLQAVVAVAVTVGFSVLLAALISYRRRRNLSPRARNQFVPSEVCPDHRLVNVEDRTRQVLDELAARSSGDPSHPGTDR